MQETASALRFAQRPAALPRTGAARPRGCRAAGRGRGPRLAPGPEAGSSEDTAEREELAEGVAAWADALEQAGAVERGLGDWVDVPNRAGRNIVKQQRGHVCIVAFADRRGSPCGKMTYTLDPRTEVPAAVHVRCTAHKCRRWFSTKKMPCENALAEWLASASTYGSAAEHLAALPATAASSSGAVRSAARRCKAAGSSEPSGGAASGRCAGEAAASSLAVGTVGRCSAAAGDTGGTWPSAASFSPAASAPPGSLAEQLAHRRGCQ
jgi:hypothetical protein